MDETAGAALERAVRRHRDLWGGEPDVVARAPGRVNLIGEHTDYNEGFTLPMALPFDTVLAMSSTGDPLGGSVSIDSVGFGPVEIDPAADPRGDGIPVWARHLAGVVHLLRDCGIPAGGWHGSIDSDIPAGASLSSSAAIEVVAATALLRRAGASWEPIDVARLGRRVENEIVAIPSGIMDQFISAGAVAGHASLMDCRAQTLSAVPLPAGTLVAVMDTGTRRILAEAAYGDRRAACERAAARLGVAALRDATVELVATIDDETDRRRAHHVVTENLRTLAAAEAMRAGDAARLGVLMRESHRSLRDDFDVSAPALDAIVDIAQSAPGCLGARMTGGGFAGCAVALVSRDRSDAFVRAVTSAYGFGGHTARVWICAPAAGASVVTDALRRTPTDDGLSRQ